MRVTTLAHDIESDRNQQGGRSGVICFEADEASSPPDPMKISPDE